MPELPEVETIRRDLERLIVGRKVLGIETNSSKQVQPSLEVVKKAIVGATIKKVQRRAKIIQIFFSNGKIIIVHLKLSDKIISGAYGTRCPCKFLDHLPEPVDLHRPYEAHEYRARIVNIKGH